MLIKKYRYSFIISKEKKKFQRRIFRIKSKTLIVDIYLKLLDTSVDDANTDLMQNRFHFVEIFVERF
jgi:hypothetical protein